MSTRREFITTAATAALALPGPRALTAQASKARPNILLRSLPGGLPGDLVSLPLCHLPVRIADAIGRAARRKNLGDLTEFGLPIPDEGVMARVKQYQQVPALVDMEVIDAIRNGSIEVVATVESFDGDKVVLVDGSRLDPHAVVLATGYRPGLEPLVGHLGVLDGKGKPVVWGERPAAQGLRFIGYDVRPSARRRGHATGMLRDALIVARGLGIESALVTCMVDNVGFRTVIERNGGVLEDERAGKLRFWVPTR